jgi:hypothetical protein
MLMFATTVGSKEWLEAKQKGRLPDTASTRKATTVAGDVWGNGTLVKAGPSVKAAQPQSHAQASRASAAPIADANART